VLTAWISLTGYWHFQKTKETQKHYQETYNRMEIIALKTPRGGLTQMAMALRKYHQENKHYPSKLIDLYPKYVISKSFITKINWKYTSGVDNFSLSKTITINNRKATASIDKSLRPTMGSTIMLATTAPVKKASVIAPLAPPLQPTPKTLTVESIPSVEQNRDLQLELEVETYIEIGSAPPVASTLSNRYLVWKNKNGNLGFGNINYPDQKNIAICTSDRWLTLAKTRRPAASRKQGSEIISNPEQNQTSVMAHNRGLLVWKNKQGVLGFGNVDYPSHDQISLIYANGDWQKINGGVYVRQ
jgi:hypothetical protein